MQQIIFRLFEICSFRAGPQDLPASTWLLRAVLLVYLAAELPRAIITSNAQIAFGGALFELTVFAFVLYGALTVVGRKYRFVQTYTAVLGVSIIFGILSLLLDLAFRGDVSKDNVSVDHLLIGLLFYFWIVCVFAHIIRHAFEIHFGYALVASFMFFMVYGQVVQSLFISQS